MIDDTTLNSFSDELQKIAGMLGEAAGTAKKWIATGWKKPAGLFEQAVHEAGPMKGKKVMDAAGKQVWKERPDATWMGHGKVTKYLPVGDKSIVTGVTAATLPGAMKKEDPEGLGRSRAERLSGLAGGTIGGLMGMGALAHMKAPSQWFRGGAPGPMKAWGVTRSIIGGMGGGMLGEHLATMPFKRKAEMPVQQPAAQPPVMPEGGVA